MPQKRDFISIMDWSSEELINNLELALELKKKTREGQCPKELEGRSYGMIFHKDSLRTRVSCEVAIFQLGGHVLTMSEKDFQMGKRESVKDVAKVLSRYLDGILIRTFSHQVVQELAEHAEVPVCNLLTDFNHPCQLMADALTILEKFGRLENIKVCYLGDCNNVTNSWLNLASRIPLDLRIATSKETLPPEHLVKQVQDAGLSKLSIYHEAAEAVQDAQVLYSDVWASMGEKEKIKEREQLLFGFQINRDLLNLSNYNSLVMHCLPANREREITAEVMDGPRSIVYDQAENRLHAQKAILAQLERWRN